MKDNLLYYLTINVTNRCNLFCSHCYAASGNSNEEDISIITIKKVLKDAKLLGLVSVLITGGEPLLRKDTEEILKYCKSLGLKVFLATNGTLIDKNSISFIKKYVDKVNISLDGLQTIHDKIRGKKGTFDITISKIKEILKKNISTSVSFTANDKNYAQIKNLAEYLHKDKNLKFLPLNVKRCISVGRSKKNSIGLSNENYLKLSGLVKNLKDKGIKISFKDPLYSAKMGKGYGCYAGIHILSIKNNGDVWVCTKLEKSIGNIKKDSLLSIWKNSSILKKLRENNSNGKGFQGCRAAAYAETKDIFGEDPLIKFDNERRK